MKTVILIYFEWKISSSTARHKRKRELQKKKKKKRTEKKKKKKTSENDSPGDKQAPSDSLLLVTMVIPHPIVKRQFLRQKSICEYCVACCIQGCRLVLREYFGRRY
ncbi:hypothetical protein ACN38_g12101 [Penicillium nordicum]|uniref:Uncharacterized protein n=1 Tax=Penicillium nordicum TaxID=229535 RepID=A0A0M9WAI5_9EURO|nr:hypothetical protein ACN38_g12101 [Penicillium nordicum]